MEKAGHDPKTPGAGARFARERWGAEWLWPALFALIVGAGMIFAAWLVRLPEPAGAKGEPVQTPGLQVTRLRWLPAGGEDRERLRLLDPTPLFMPGAASVDVSAGGVGIEDRQSGLVGAAFPPSLVFAEQRPARDILRPRAPASAPAGETWLARARWFEGMPRLVDAAGAAFSPGKGSVEVFVAGSSGRAVAAVLPDDALLAAVDWRPVEMSVLVSAAGAVAPPVVTNGSGMGEVDERVRLLVGKEVLPTLNLRPGAYRLVAGP